jgi:NADH-quinone oxidoreductase subunit H
LAETNRAPFDLPEAEAELVAGYNVEYSAIMFAAFFLGEYANILLMSTLFVIFFFGGGHFFLTKPITSGLFNTTLNSLWLVSIFTIKVISVTFIFIFVRANLPRFRFDQLMFIG